MPKMKTFLTIPALSSTGIGRGFSSRFFNPGHSICMTAGLGMLWRLSESMNVVLQKCWRFWNCFFIFLWQNTYFRKSFQCQRCLNSVFSTSCDWPTPSPCFDKSEHWLRFCFVPSLERHNHLGRKPCSLHASSGWLQSSNKILQPTSFQLPNKNFCHEV